MSATPWLAVTNGQALRFFYERLRDVVHERASGVSALAAGNDELLYNASVLAHFASTSTASSTDFPPSPVNLSTVFDLFVLDRSQHVDPEIMEAAGSQCLMLTGFFQDQLRQRHNVDWYARLGADFYDSAAHLSRDVKRVRILGAMAAHFEFWRHQQRRLAAELRDEPRLIHVLDDPSEDVH
jgi:hypothetical protein